LTGKKKATTGILIFFHGNFSLIKNKVKIIQEILSFKIIFYSVLIGILCGFGAVLFTYGLELAVWFFQHVLMGQPAGTNKFSSIFQTPSIILPYAMLLVPMAGAFFSGILSYFAPETQGGGTDSIIASFHHKKGVIKKSIPIIKTFTTIFTLGSGGSGGKEGPIMQIGAGIGSYIAQKLKLSVKERRILLLAGAAAGLGAVFKAPLGGAITAVEAPYKKDFELEALIPSVVASITSYTLYCTIFDYSPLFTFHSNFFRSPASLLFYALLAIISAVLGHVFILILKKSKTIFNAIKLPIYLKTALGGLLVGGIGVYYFDALGLGITTIQKLISIPSYLPLYALLLFALLKIMTTSLTVSSGGSGGLLIPCLFIGAFAGAFVGKLGMQIAPEIVDSYEPFVLVGMAAMLSGIANAHLGGIIIVSEISQGYGLLAPLLFTSSLTILLTSRVSIYENQVENKLHSPAHIDEIKIKLLEDKKVEKENLSLNQSCFVSQNETLRELMKKITRLGNTDFIVVSSNKNKKFSGMLSGIGLDIEDIKEIQDIAVVNDLEINPTTPVIVLGESMLDAFRKFITTPYNKIAVVEKEEVVGFLTYDHFLTIFEGNA